ncbi:MAG: NrdH-redoxin [Acidobacteria bacterium]|nr:NrdH-redoxin [Acidobacteriota bacterium]
MTSDTLTVYGALWCPDCRRSKSFLDARGIAYQWVDVDADAAGSAEVERLNGGPRIIPTIVKATGDFIVEPSDSQLAAFLGVAV